MNNSIPKNCLIEILIITNTDRMPDSNNYKYQRIRSIITKCYRLTKNNDNE